MYQYISDDEHSYTLKGKDGKEFKVAKQSISDAIHGKITSMKPKKMADGGIVESVNNFVKTRSEPVQPGDENNYPDSFANNFASKLPDAVAPYFKRSMADEKNFHQNFGENAGMAGMGTVENVGKVVKGPWTQEAKALQEQTPSMLDNFMARFGDNKKITNAIKKAQSSSSNPYVDISHVDKSIGWAPNFHGQSVSEIGQPGIAGSHFNKNLDPFMWSDTKYGASKEMLNNAKGPMKIHTSSDLIARDDYSSIIPHGSEVNMYLMPKNNEFGKHVFPGNPSRLRQEQAIEKLQQQGIKVNAIEPTPDSILMAVKNKIPRSGLEFGNQKNDPFKNLTEVLGVSPFGIEGKRKLYQMMNGKGNIGPVANFAQGGIVPDALNPDYQQIDQSSYMPDLSAPMQMPAQPVQQYQSPDPGVISNDQWNQLSAVDRQSYLDPLHAKADQSPLGKIGSFIGDMAGQGRQEKQQQLEQTGAINKPIEVPQVETPEMALQKQLQAQSQLPQVEQQQSNYNFPQAQSLGLMQGIQAPLMRNALAQENMYKTQADMYGKMGEQADEFKRQADHMQKAKQDVGAEYDKLFNDVKNQKIDPYKVWNDSSTGQKAGIVVGMLLSGIGQGLQGPGATNMAIDAYNKQVDRSIEAQKMELGKKENLLSQNLRRYGDLHTAEAATRAAYVTAMGAKISQAGAMAQSQEAKNNAQLAYKQTEMQMLPLTIQLANARAMAMSYGMGNSAGGIPVQQEPFGLLSNPEYMKKRVVFNNRAYPAVDDKAADELRNMLSKYSGIKTLVNELSDISKKNNGVALGPIDRARVEQIRSQLIPENMAYDDFKRLTKEDLENFGKSFSNPNSVMGFVEGDVRNKQFLKHLDESLNEAMKNKLVKFGGMPGQGFQPLGKAKGR